MIDLRRLARAIHLEAEPLPGGRWTVTGGSMDHIVSETRRGLECDCVDGRLGRLCKHRLCIMLRAGDVTVLRALRELIPQPKARSRAA